MMSGRVLFLSIRPEHGDRILQGAKTVELRRISPLISEGDKVILYFSSPVKAVRATTIVDNVSRLELDDLWRKIKKKAGITKAEFDEYFDGLDEGVAIHIKNVYELPNSVTLSALRRLWPGFVPPQSYRYFSDKQLDRLMKEAKKC
jgi:predicted transcriptional regulator